MKRIAIILLVVASTLFLTSSSVSTAPPSTYASSWLFRTCNAFGYNVPDYGATYARLRPPAQGTELVVWVYTQQQEEALKLAKSSFEAAHPDMKVTITNYGDSSTVHDKFWAAAVTGEGPDIVVGPSEWGLEFLSGAIQLFEITNAPSFTGNSQYCWICEMMKYFGLPATTSNVAFIRNLDYVPDAPATWDDVRAVAGDLVYSKGLVDYGFVFPMDAYHFAGIQNAFGGGLFGGDSVILDNEGSIAAGEWLQSMVKDGLTPAYIVDYSSSLDLFTSGKAGMTIQGPWALEALDSSGISYAVSPLPGGGQPYVSSTGFMVSANSKNPDLAIEFLNQYVATNDVMATLVDGTFELSAYQSVLETQLGEDSRLVGFSNAGANGIPVPFQFSSVASIWTTAIQDIILGNSTPDEALSKAADEIRGMVGS